MSLPCEHLLALRRARDLLVELAVGSTKRVPAEVRARARAILCHFPTSALALEDAANEAHMEAIASGEALR